jgi:hypothetical protein
MIAEKKHRNKAVEPVVLPPFPLPKTLTRSHKWALSGYETQKRKFSILNVCTTTHVDGPICNSIEHDFNVHACFYHKCRDESNELLLTRVPTLFRLLVLMIFWIAGIVIYVNPADLVNLTSVSGIQNLATPASSTSSKTLLTPEIPNYLPGFNESNASYVMEQNNSVNVFSFDLSMASFSDANCIAVNDQYTLMDDVHSFSQSFANPTSTSTTDDSDFTKFNSNVPFQFTWQATSRSHGSNEFGTALPFESSHSSVSPIDVILKQENKLDSINLFSSEAVQNTQLFSSLGEEVDFFQTFERTVPPTPKEPVDTIGRDNLLSAIQSSGVQCPDLPSSADWVSISTPIGRLYILIYRSSLNLDL